ncbi:imidazolonepropionase [Legionella jordanis]|uniref:Imidazolonepropionase n=1 Tax=Legionella jordanis TaxID=456 RepID=A0A0W0V920_9GAMM|nr:imidazolonepropionase [Legionella jordanis]KTD16580.1 imidazolonepropionase [Legionella jordanis]RMX03880.1 imidazolonepropionase [Legionella jordanis]VEH11956.1 imidazolonepropionase [Legionella jordanis]
MQACDRLLLNAKTLSAQGEELPQQAIAIANGLIAWCGPMMDLPQEYIQHATAIHECENELVTPGLIDCHTHLVYAGDRAHEFRLRLEGKTYAEIAQSGGGILSTVKQTRAASLGELIEQSLPRILAMRAQGVTTVEIKSGYGLDLKNEIKMLRAAKELGSLSGLRVCTTFLGAHCVPPEFQTDAQSYVNFLCAELIPAIADSGLADAVDVFCESIAFNLSQTEQIFQKAQDCSLAIKCHAEQLSNLGASKLAARYSALSCDHLEFLDAEGAAEMAQSGTVAVLLPGAFYFLKENRKPPIELLREKSVGIAIATDANPGSSPTTSLPLMMNMACQLFNLGIAEAWSAVTYQAARALGLAGQIGEIAVGKAADLVRWSVTDSSALCYYFGHQIEHSSMIAGEWLSQ